MSGQGGKELGELKGLSVPVRVSGPFDALKYKVEFSQMIGGPARRRSRRRPARRSRKA
jgi:AsmA protein